MHNSIFSKLSFLIAQEWLDQFIHVQLSKICGKTRQKTLLAEAFMGLGRNFELYFNITAWPVFNPLIVVC